MQLPNKHRHTTSNVSDVSKQSFNDVLIIVIKFRQKLSKLEINYYTLRP